jgi:uracil-DNA glycosylase family 4
MALPLASLKLLNQEILECQNCPRLINWCREVAQTKKKAYADQEYWGGPVPSFGPDSAKILIVGLAPGAHGANRTGRIFTGDRSGDWLYRALFNNGLAASPHSVDRFDGQRLIDTRITCVVHCAPPENKPSTQEQEICSQYLRRELELLKPKVVIALGGIAWEHSLRSLRALGMELPKPKPKFGHGASTNLDQITLLGSYHPSQQNTFTGKLTEEMLDSIFATAKTIAAI